MFVTIVGNPVDESTLRGDNLEEVILEIQADHISPDRLNGEVWSMDILLRRIASWFGPWKFPRGQIRPWNDHPVGGRDSHPFSHNGTHSTTPCSIPPRITEIFACATKGSQRHFLLSRSPSIFWSTCWKKWAGPGQTIRNTNLDQAPRRFAAKTGDHPSHFLKFMSNRTDFLADILE
jgi:hypothetical protein